MELKPVTSIDAELERLAVAARADGHANIDLLVNEFRSGMNQFSRPGEALLGAFTEGQLIGIGGLNIDPYEQHSNAGRIRRLYVHPNWRGAGIGAVIVAKIESLALGRFPVIQLFTESAQAGRFYEGLGYSRQSRAKVSHAKGLAA